MNDDRTPAELERALAMAEAELAVLGKQTRAAYREYEAANQRQSIKAAEVRELRMALRKG